MEEKSDLVAAPSRAQRLAKRGQMVVMYPHQIIGLKQFCQMAREVGIDTRITLIKRAVVRGEVGAVVEQRPQCAIGKAVVILVAISGREIERRIGDPASFNELGATLLLFAYLSAPPEPHATRGA